MKHRTHAYVARQANVPGVYAVVVDDPAYPKDTAATVAEWIKEGAQVDRIPIEQVHEEMGKWIAAQPKQLKLPTERQNNE